MQTIPGQMWPKSLAEKGNEGKHLGQNAHQRKYSKQEQIAQQLTFRVGHDQIEHKKIVQFLQGSQKDFLAKSILKLINMGLFRVLLSAVGIICS